MRGRRWWVTALVVGLMAPAWSNAAVGAQTPPGPSAADPAPSESTPAAPPAPSGRPVVDFDGNGVEDVFWYAPGSAPDYIWTGHGDGFTSAQTDIATAHDAVTGDFDGDGRTDVFWYTPGSGADLIWNGADRTSVRTDVVVNGVYRPIAGDFDANGFDDVFWYSPGGAPDFWWSSGPDGFSSREQPVNGDYVPLVGDFDANGHTDIFWYAPGTAPDFIWYFDPAGRHTTSVTVNLRYTPLTGDFDGDGGTDIFWYAPGGDPDFIWMATPDGFVSHPTVVNLTYDPVTGDFDGDGRTDIIWYGVGATADFRWTARVAATPGRGTAPAFDSAPTSIQGVYWPLAATVRHPLGRSVGDSLATSPFATMGAIELRHPSPQTEFIGFHQSGSTQAPMLTVAPTAVRSATLPSRGRGTGARTAADVVVPPGTEIRSPVSGIVVDSASYRLYCRYPDDRVVIRPDSSGAYDVVVLHLSGRRVAAGDRVEAGVTPIATARRLPFDSQVDEYSGQASWPHAHIELQPQSATTTVGGC